MNKILLVIAAVVLVQPFSAFAQKKVYDRGYDLSSPSAIVAPAKSWMIGGNLGFSTSTQNKYQFFIVNGINANGMNISAAPQFCYHFADNMGFGIRGRYTRTYQAIDSANAQLSDDMKFNIRNYTYLRQRYMGAAFYRYYYPFGKSGRISGFFEAELSAGGSQAKIMDAHSVDVKGAYENCFSAGFCGNVGLIVFVTPHFAIDLNMSLLQLDYYSNDQTINNVDKGSLNFGTANFMFNLLSMAIGLNYYL